MRRSILHRAARSCTTRQETAGDRPETFVVWAKTNQERSLDLDGTGTTLGDRIVLNDDPSRTRGGRVVGFDGGGCAVVKIDEPMYQFTSQCLVTVSLPNGIIATQGLITFTRGVPQQRVDLAVTGGTGNYDTAHCEVQVRFVTDTEARYEIHLQ